MNSSPGPPEEEPIRKRRLEKHVTLYIGGVHASDEPIVIKTLLGSCVAVTLFDPLRRVGGMNHFLLPRSSSGKVEPEATQFGTYAMDRLIAAVMKVGADRRQLVAKVFGGAHVLGEITESPQSVPRQNSAFAREFLMLEGIPIKSWDVGGQEPREVHFHPTSGRAFVRRLPRAQLRKRLVQRESDAQKQRPDFGSITFFDPE